MGKQMVLTWSYLSHIVTNLTDLAYLGVFHYI